MDTKDEMVEALETEEPAEAVAAEPEQVEEIQAESAEAPSEEPASVVETVFEGYETSPAVDTDDGDDDEELETEDSLTYSNGVIEKIVAIATREVPHVLGMKGNLFHAIQEQFVGEVLTKGVSVDVTDDNRVMVNISVIIEYGSSAPQIFEDVKERVTESLASMTGLEVAGINLRIENVVTREEYEQSQRRIINNRKSATDKAETTEAETEPEAEVVDAEVVEAEAEEVEA